MINESLRQERILNYCDKLEEENRKLKAYLETSVSCETLLATEAERDEARDVARWLYKFVDDSVWEFFTDDDVKKLNKLEWL